MGNGKYGSHLPPSCDIKTTLPVVALWTHLILFLMSCTPREKSVIFGRPVPFIYWCKAHSPLLSHVQFQVAMSKTWITVASWSLVEWTCRLWSENAHKVFALLTLSSILLHVKLNCILCLLTLSTSCVGDLFPLSDYSLGVVPLNAFSPTSEQHLLHTPQPKNA